MNMNFIAVFALTLSAGAAGIDFSTTSDFKPFAMRVYGVRGVVAESETSVRVIFGASVTDMRRKAAAAPRRSGRRTS